MNFRARRISRLSPPSGSRRHIFRVAVPRPTLLGMRKNTIQQLLLGDATKRLAEIPDASVDLVLTDPPYNTGM